MKIERERVFCSIFEQVQVKRVSFDTEMFAASNLMDVKIAELPVNTKPDRVFRSKEIIRMTLDVVAVAFRPKVLECIKRI